MQKKNIVDIDKGTEQYKVSTDSGIYKISLVGAIGEKKAQNSLLGRWGLQLNSA